MTVHRMLQKPSEEFRVKCDLVSVHMLYEATRDAWSAFQLAPFYYGSRAALEAIDVGRPDIAIEILKIDLSHNPHDVKSWTQLSLLLEDQGELKLAIKAAAQTISIEPENPFNYTRLAQLFFKTGEYAKSVIVLKYAAFEFPEDQAIPTMLVTALRKQKPQVLPAVLLSDLQGEFINDLDGTFAEPLARRDRLRPRRA